MRKSLLFLIIVFPFLTTSAQTPLSTATDFTVTTVEGNSFNLFSTLAGNKFVCIDFFYYSCVPCQQTAPKVNGAYEYFGCNTGNVIFIGMDDGDITDTTIAFGNKFGAHYPAASGADGGGNAVVSAYGITGFPTIILIAPDHSIVEQDIWPVADAAYLYNLIEGHGGIPASCPSGIKEITNNNIYISGIYPNPAREKVSVEFYLADVSDISMKIYNVTGQEVFIVSVPDIKTGINYTTLPLDDLSNGIYIIKLIQDNHVFDLVKLSVIN
jgi:hypothetical protein